MKLTKMGTCSKTSTYWPSYGFEGMQITKITISKISITQKIESEEATIVHLKNVVW